MSENSASWGGAFGGDCVANNCTLTGNSAVISGGGSFGNILNNCVLATNTAGWSGGGTMGGVLNHCVLVGNSAQFQGGGAEGGTTLNNCLLTTNAARSDGGGAAYATLYNCTLVGNSAQLKGGGAYTCEMANCIMYYNIAQVNADFAIGSLANCCTPGVPPVAGNISDPPLFVNPEAGDFRLKSQSPCINAGSNLYVPWATDLDGNPRLVGCTVDMGAYEFQDYYSSIRIASILTAGSDVALSWESELGRSYFVDYSTNLSIRAAFSRISSDIPGQNGTTTFTHTNGLANPTGFYRVGLCPN